MKSKTYITLIVFCLFSNQLFAQLAEFKKTTDKRYLGKLNWEGGYAVHYGPMLIESFELGFEWWTLMGEPLEIYHFKWKAKDSYMIDSKKCNRADLLKYPDLLKRFDNIRPSHIDLRLEGTLSGHVVKAGEQEKTEGYYEEDWFHSKEGESNYRLNQDFIYLIKDAKLYYSKAGEEGNDLVPGSPDWNNFLRYKPYDYAWEKGDPNDEKLKSKNLTIYKNSSILTMQVWIEKIEWPEHELRAIIKQYEAYEAGESVPSPIEYTDSIIAKNKNVPTYTKDDEWAQPLPDFKLTSFYDNQTGKYGYKNEYGQVAIAPKFSKAGEFENRMAIVDVDGKVGIISKAGIYLMEPKFHKIEQIYKNVVVIRDEDFNYRLCNLQGEFINDLKFYSIDDFENGQAKVKILVRKTSKDFDLGLQCRVDYFDIGKINTNGDWIEGPREAINARMDYYFSVDHPEDLTDSHMFVLLERREYKEGNLTNRQTKLELIDKIKRVQTEMEKYIRDLENEMRSRGGVVL